MKTYFQKIAVGVFAVHFLLLSILWIHHAWKGKARPVRPLVVKSVVISAPAPPPPSVVTVKPAAPKKVDKKKEKIAKEVAQLKKEMKKEAVIEKKRAQLAVPKPLPQKVQPPIEQPAPTYGEFLIAFLENALDLPEYGDVKARIEIDRFGHLVHCQILESKNGQNAIFLQSRLQEIEFPRLDEYGISEPSHSFTITFRNVEKP
jgi:hypothetical protein